MLCVVILGVVKSFNVSQRLNCLLHTPALGVSTEFRLTEIHLRGCTVFRSMISGGNQPRCFHFQRPLPDGKWDCWVSPIRAVVAKCPVSDGKLTDCNGTVLISNQVSSDKYSTLFSLFCNSAFPFFLFRNSLIHQMHNGDPAIPHSGSSATIPLEIQI